MDMYASKSSERVGYHILQSLTEHMEHDYKEAVLCGISHVAFAVGGKTCSRGSAVFPGTTCSCEEKKIQ